MHTDPAGIRRHAVEVAGRRFGDGLLVIAGPCAVESEEQILLAARQVKEAGADLLRGGAYKPRTRPGDFQGLGEAALRHLRTAREATGLPVVTEIMDPRHLEAVCACADVLQIGSRNMQNYTLLRELGRIDRPVILKRGMSATLAEWLHAADYILEGGNGRVILCERGIRTFETATRNTLDLSVVPALRQVSPLPVIVDPSHSTGRAALVPPMCLAAVAAGADGLLVEVHPRPAEAACDRDQQLDPARFAALMPAVRALAAHLRGAPAEGRP